MNKPAVDTIIENLGPEAIRARLRVSQHAVRYAKSTGAFAASWFREISTMCAEAGVPCPMDAFNWRETAAGADDERGAA